MKNGLVSGRRSRLPKWVNLHVLSHNSCLLNLAFRRNPDFPSWLWMNVDLWTFFQCEITLRTQMVQFFFMQEMKTVTKSINMANKIWECYQLPCKFLPPLFSFHHSHFKRHWTKACEVHLHTSWRRKTYNWPIWKHLEDNNVLSASLFGILQMDLKPSLTMP